MPLRHPNVLAVKILATGKRAADIFRYLPRRCRRLEEYFRALTGRGESEPLKHFAYWTLEFLFLLLDCAGAGEIFETLAEFIKYNSRPLSERERILARSVFGNTLDLDRVRLDERACLGPRQARFCYVSFFHVNSWGAMPDDLFVHELMHVWQYEHLGICYIPRALRAQWSAEGYDYGGVEGLQKARRHKKGLFQFNYEQQADIVADYFRIREGKTPRWGRGTAADLRLYKIFIDEMRFTYR